MSVGLIGFYMVETTGTIPAGGAANVTAWVNGNDVVVGGGYWVPDGITVVGSRANAPNDGPPNGWVVSAENPGTTALDITVSAVCVTCPTPLIGRS